MSQVSPETLIVQTFLKAHRIHLDVRFVVTFLDVHYIGVKGRVQRHTKGIEYD